ncbi:MAG: hypothetical protein WD270_13450 [Acetobacterales bacterium]
MTGRKLTAAVAALCIGLALGAGTARAAEPSIRVLDAQVSTNYEAFLDQVTGMIAKQAARAAASASGGSGGAFYFDLNTPTAEMSGFAGLGEADRSLVKAAKSTYDLYRALGGQRIEGSGFVERRDNRYYIGLDGEGGRWLATPEEALASLVDQFQGHRFRFSKGGEPGISCPLDFRCILRATYTGEVETVAYAPRGTTVTLELTGEGFVNAGGPPVLKVPAGLLVQEVTYIDSETVQVRLSITEAAGLGLNVLYAFNEGRAFRSLGAYGLHVVAGAEELQALLLELTSAETVLAEGEAGTETDAGTAAEPTYAGPPLLSGSGEVEAVEDDAPSTPADAVMLALGTTTEGRLEVAGDVDLFRVEVTQPGTLVLSSAGPSDVTGSLEDGDGAILAADDDSAGWYNFRLERPVGPGTYFLRVGHCCAGAGGYRLSGSFTAD